MEDHAAQFRNRNATSLCRLQLDMASTNATVIPTDFHPSMGVFWTSVVNLSTTRTPRRCARTPAELARPALPVRHLAVLPSTRKRTSVKDKRHPRAPLLTRKQMQDRTAIKKGTTPLPLPPFFTCTGKNPRAPGGNSARPSCSPSG